MNSLMNKNFLKSIYCILVIIVFQVYAISMSFAGVLNKNTGGSLIQKSNADHKVNKDEDGDESDDDDEHGNKGNGNGNDNNDEDEDSHNAGKNCLTSGCHLNGEHTFSIGGTIYDDAEGTNARKGAKIKITDADGQKVRLRSDQLGNFYSGKDLTVPFTISVSYLGRTVSMPVSADSGGGCNADGCHTTQAEGRVFINTNDLDLTGMVVSSDTGGNSSEISYESDVKSILDAKCISCHKEGGSNSDTPLTTYEEVTDPNLVTPGSEDSLLLRKLDKNSSEGTMWPNLNSNSDYNTIKDWIVLYNAQEYSSDTADVTSEPVAGAKVRLSKNGKIKYQTKTDEGGEFVLEGVKAGTYSLKVYKKGYKAHNQTYQMNQTDVTPLEIPLTKK